MNSSDAQLFSLLSGIIGLITLIVFFMMSSNISKIRTLLENLNTNKPTTSYVTPFNMGELREFQGKKQEALDCYMESYFLVNKFIKKGNVEGLDMSKDIKNKELIKSKIVELGGTIPEIK